MSNDLSLTVNGTNYSGWQNVNIQRSLDQLADTFSVSYTDAVTDGVKLVPIYEGDAVNVKIDGKQVIPGFVDDAKHSYSASQTGASVQGRSYLGDVVDCTAEYVQGKGSWTNANLVDIVKAILSPFGLNAQLDSSVGALKPFRRFALQDGESAAEAICRAAGMRAVLATSTPDGSVLLTRVGKVRSNTTLKYGQNIFEGSLSGSWRDRFSKYTVKCQAAGDDSFNGAAATYIKRTVMDTSIDRYRPLTIMADNEDQGTELEIRAAWERNVRAGRQRGITYTWVGSWYDDDGKLWSPNTLVQIDDDYLEIKDTLLIASVTYSRGMEGTTTQLEVTSPAAYDVQPLPPPKPKKVRGFSL